MLARELAIVLRARITWLQAALSAVLVGHGFILAVDLYSAGSRSVRDSLLLAQEFDPLLGIVRPTLGGLYLAVSLLGPIVAARSIAIEKERRTWPSLLLQVAAPGRLLGAKFLAGLSGTGLQLIAPLALLMLWRASGGHLDPLETAVAFSGYALYICLVTAVATAAAAWTRTLAQAATMAILAVAASWAIDASEGFTALAWLGRALDWSVTTHLYPMERGTLALGAALWMAGVTLGALAFAWVGIRSDLSWPRRSALALGALLATGLGGTLARRVPYALDLTEARRGSLPPAAIRGLRELPGPIRLEVNLDRDDARRQQLESDALAKLRLARPDLKVRMPRDERTTPAEAERDEGYGRLTVEAGGGRKETTSTSDRELVTLIFEAAGRSPPDWSQPEYPGYPRVVEGHLRRALALTAYLGLPLVLAAVGSLINRTRRSRR